MSRLRLVLSIAGLVLLWVLVVAANVAYYRWLRS